MNTKEQLHFSEEKEIIMHAHTQRHTHTVFLLSEYASYMLRLWGTLIATPLSLVFFRF